MRFLVLTLVLAVSACATHRQPPASESPLPVTQFDPPTEQHCKALIQDLIDHMNTVDFNKDRKGEITKSIAKARAEQAKGRFDKCVSFARKAIYWSR
ncbi:MAG: hypothetical protein WAW96_08615 [Alphaproteobacteria bacterium]